MPNKTDDHAGSGLDKPSPKTLLEKVGDGVKAVLPTKAPKPPVTDTGKGSAPRLPE